MADIVSTLKTYQLGTDNVTYFEVVTTTYDDEAQDIQKRPVGPAAVLTADQADKMGGRIRTLAGDAHTVSRAGKVLADINADDANVTTATGKSPLTLIQSRYLAELSKSGWTIDDGSVFPIVFTQNAQGVLKYSINGAATKNAKIYGAVIRLNNYPASPTDTDFFLAETGKQYYSLPNRAVKIKNP